MTATEELGKLLVNRHQVLAEIIEESQDKRYLQESLNIPRSTLDKIVRELEDADLVTYTTGEWEPTLLGECLCHVQHEYLSRVSTLTQTAGIINTLLTDTPLNHEFLVGATPHQSKHGVLDEVFQPVIDSSEDATTFRFITPSMISAYIQPLFNQLTNSTTTAVELVMPRSLVAQLMRIEPALTDTVLDDDTIQIFTGAIPDQYGIWITDQRAGMIVFSAGGIAGILVNDSPTAIQWAESQYTALIRATQPLKRNPTAGNANRPERPQKTEPK